VPTTRSSPETILAHVELLRAVDGLLSQAEVVRSRRDALNRLLSPNSANERRASKPAAGAEVRGAK